MPVPAAAAPVPLADSDRNPPCASPVGAGSLDWWTGVGPAAGVNLPAARSNAYCSTLVLPGQMYSIGPCGPSQNTGLPTIQLPDAVTAKRCTICVSGTD